LPVRLSQDELFAASEGDRWFERNRGHLTAAEDPILGLIEQCGIEPQAVVELGASNGYRVAELQRKYNCKSVAVDVSAAAVAAGREAFPAVEFALGPVYEVPVRRQFDLVIVNFVLHWVQRSNLMRAAAEIDRLLAPSGFLALGDFLPSSNVRVPYRHLPGADVWTFKQDYARLFTASGLYRTIVSVSGRHGGPVPAVSVGAGDRVGYTILQKDLEGYAPVTPEGGA